MRALEEARLLLVLLVRLHLAQDLTHRLLIGGHGLGIDSTLLAALILDFWPLLLSHFILIDCRYILLIYDFSV